MIFHRAYVEMTSGVLLGAFAGLSLGAARAGIISSRTTAVRSVSRVLTGWYMAGLSRVTAKSDRCEFVLSILTTTNLATRRISSHFISIEKPTHNSISSTPSDLQPAELTSTPPASPWHNLCNFLSSPLLQLNMASIRKKHKDTGAIRSDDFLSSVVRHSFKSLRYARNASFPTVFITFNYNELRALCVFESFGCNCDPLTNALNWVLSHVICHLIKNNHVDRCVFGWKYYSYSHLVFPHFEAIHSFSFFPRSAPQSHISRSSICYMAVLYSKCTSSCFFHIHRHHQV